MNTPSEKENTSTNKLFDFSKTGTNTKNAFGAPSLIPKDSKGLNITMDFPWTTLPKQTRQDVPCIELTEFRVTGSTMIQSAFQQARSAVDAVQTSSAYLTKGLTDGLSIVGFQVSDSDINSYLNKNIYNQPWLDPYKHLYPSEPTGWRYIFPFLTGQNQKNSNNWSTDNKSDIGKAFEEFRIRGTGGGFSNILNALEVGGKISKLGNTLEPGSFTETIKHYAPSEDESYKVSFTLNNTLNFDDIQKNWELCFILTYQNRPNRRSVSLLDPPAIYSATIPGVNKFLYSYISNLQIDNLGTSRLVDLDNGRKLIPEAYQISFDLKNLLTPTQNLLLYAHQGDKVEASVR